MYRRIHGSQLRTRRRMTGANARAALVVLVLSALIPTLQILGGWTFGLGWIIADAIAPVVGIVALVLVPLSRSRWARRRVTSSGDVLAHVVRVTLGGVAESQLALLSVVDGTLRLDSRDACLGLISVDQIASVRIADDSMVELEGTPDRRVLLRFSPLGKFAFFSLPQWEVERFTNDFRKRIAT